MASNTLKNEAYEARLQLEQANMKLAGIIAAHDLLHISAESDTPMSAELMFPFLAILDGAIEDIRERIEAASCVLMALASEETPSGDQGADAYGK